MYDLEVNIPTFVTYSFQDKDMPLRLFECYDSTGNFTVEEVVGDWDQSDLNSDNVMLLDSWSSLYVWIGESCGCCELLLRVLVFRENSDGKTAN